MTTVGCATSADVLVNTRGLSEVSIALQRLGGLNGGLYFPWDQDDLVARKVLEIENRERYRAPIINEAAPCTSTAKARCWSPKSACSMPTAIQP